MINSTMPAFSLFLGIEGTRGRAEERRTADARGTILSGRRTAGESARDKTARDLPGTMQEHRAEMQEMKDLAGYPVYWRLTDQPQ